MCGRTTCYIPTLFEDLEAVGREHQLVLLLAVETVVGELQLRAVANGIHNQTEVLRAFRDIFVQHTVGNILGLIQHRVDSHSIEQPLARATRDVVLILDVIDVAARLAATYVHIEDLLDLLLVTVELTFWEFVFVIVVVATMHPAAVDVLAGEIARSNSVDQPEINVNLVCCHILC